MHVVCCEPKSGLVANSKSDLLAIDAMADAGVADYGDLAAVAVAVGPGLAGCLAAGKL